MQGGRNGIILGEAPTNFGKKCHFFRHFYDPKRFHGPNLGEARASDFHQFRPPCLYVSINCDVSNWSKEKIISKKIGKKKINNLSCHVHGYILKSQVYFLNNIFSSHLWSTSFHPINIENANKFYQKKFPPKSWLLADGHVVCLS